MANIVLAHGIAGCGNIFRFRHGFYFNRVAKLYTSKGHTVLEPTVAALGSLATRSDQLARAIKAKWPSDEPIHIVCHSMGGLDSRRMMALDNAMALRVKTLITIATPHLGSPLASAMCAGRFMPKWIARFIKRLAPACQDLQSRTALQDADQPSVKYITIACQRDEGLTASPLFAFSRLLGGLTRHKNDGVVEFASASPAQNLPVIFWPVDHGSAIGWPSGYCMLAVVPAVFRPPAAHLGRYEALLDFMI